MIITCPSCKKKFEVNATLIPDKGRKLKCGACDKEWFYRHNLEKSSNIASKTISIQKDQASIPTIEEKEIEDEIKINEDFKDDIIRETKKIKNKDKDVKIKSFKFRKLVSYFFVSIISFIAIILILDTFNTQLSNIFPGLELLLFNLFESIKDISLFVKDLL